jgi:hypothetical protein
MQGSVDGLFSDITQTLPSSEEADLLNFTDENKRRAVRT